jgi:adenine deaminase
MKIDLIIKNAYVFQTYRQCFEKRDIAIAEGKFYYIAPAISYDADKLIDYTGKYIIPGLIDIHMHIESSMTFPLEFARTVPPLGTTTIVADPHEIANVFGIEGIEVFMKQPTALDIFYGIPSSVPATNREMETSGGTIDEAAVLKLLSDDRVICLGEVMNYQDLISEKETKIKKLIELCKLHDKQFRIEGHCPKLSHEDSARFIFAGVDSDHTEQSKESLLEKIDQGMFVELQRKSMTKEVIETIKEYNLYESVALITDDTMPDHLINGQLNLIVKEAIRLGIPKEKAIYIATHTPARRMNLTDRGAITPGKIADFVVLEDVEEFKIIDVYKNGKRCNKEDNSMDKLDYSNLFPKHFYHSVHCKLADKDDFEITVDKTCSSVEANVIQIAEFGTFTKQVTKRLEVRDGKVCWQEAGLTLITIFERHGKNGNISHGLIQNALTKDGAVATTWSHDSHNLFVLGTCVEDMVKVQNHIVKNQGGYCVAAQGEIIANADLKVGGILSDAPIEEVAGKIKEVRSAIEALGYKNNNVIMSISTLALLVSPELKISDKGLFQVKTQKFIPLIKYID